ncbi:MAG: ABC transporter permease subunit [Candidatus Paceibacterota bacterium]
MPSISQMYHEVVNYVTVPDKRSGKVLFIEDTKASLTRLGLGVSISAVFGYVLGILMGLYPGFRSLFNTIITTLSNINPLMMLVIILVALGIGELSKIFLIVFGIGIPLTRSIEEAVEKIPQELIVKQETLGASQLGIIYRLIMPQMLPRLIDLVRMSLGAAWIFVIAAEAIASTSGLGYRVFLQQRYMNMSLIIPIVIFITIVAFSSDWILKAVLKLRRFKWYSPGN